MYRAVLQDNIEVYPQQEVTLVAAVQVPSTTGKFIESFKLVSSGIEFGDTLYAQFDIIADTPEDISTIESIDNISDLDTLIQLGFDSEIASQALQKSNGNLKAALLNLASNK